MAVYSVTKHGFTTIASLLTDIHDEITTAHSGATYFQHRTATAPTSGSTTGRFIYESLPDIDPLATYTPAGNQINCAWRICFNLVSQYRLAIHVGTRLQFPDSGTLAFLNNRAMVSPTLVEPPGNLAETWNGVGGIPNAATFEQTWLDRSPSAGSEGAYPMSYVLTLTNRGIFLAVWEDSQEEIPAAIDPLGGHGNSPVRWFLIQRSVDRVTGHVRGGAAMRGSFDPANETSKCPVYCVGGTNNKNQWYKFIVRENDVLSPSRKKFAIASSTDSSALLNPFEQQSLTETGEFIVTFLNNLSTPRYRYSDELDMIGTVGAEVIGPGTSINVTVYNEAQPRTYTALYSNIPYGKGMRLMVLTAGNATVENSHTIGNFATTTTTTIPPTTTSTTTVL